MDDVDPGGVADMAGISKGDFLLAINGEDVTQASHERVVTLIRQSGDLVNLTVVTVTPELGAGAITQSPHQKHFSTLPRKMPGVSGVRSPLQQPPPPPKRDPTTTLSVGRARAKSMLANLAAIDALDSALKDKDKVKEASEGDKTNGQSVAQELELIFKRESGLTAGTTKASSSVNSSPALSKKKVYNSVAQMKRSKNSGIDLNNLHKDYHSTPDLQTQSGREKVGPEHDNASVTKDLDQFNRNAPRRIHSQEDLHLLSSKDSSGVSHHGSSNVHPAGYFTLPHKKSGASRSGPAPVHPPPPPPAPGTLVYMASRINGSSDYAKVSPKTQEAPASSFNPSSSARLYESPKDVANIGYTDNVPNNNQTNGIKMKKSPTRTNSLPSRPRPMVLKRIEVS